MEDFLGRVATVTFFAVLGGTAMAAGMSLWGHIVDECKSDETIRKEQAEAEQRAAEGYVYMRKCAEEQFGRGAEPSAAPA
jgi:hypothetical protein